MKINLGTQYDEDRGVNNKWIDMVVEGQDVYIVRIRIVSYLFGPFISLIPTA